MPLNSFLEPEYEFLNVRDQPPRSGYGEGGRRYLSGGHKVGGPFSPKPLLDRGPEAPDSLHIIRSRPGWKKLSEAEQGQVMSQWVRDTDEYMKEKHPDTYNRSDLLGLVRENIPELQYKYGGVGNFFADMATSLLDTPMVGEKFLTGFLTDKRFDKAYPEYEMPERTRLFVTPKYDAQTKTQRLKQKREEFEVGEAMALDWEAGGMPKEAVAELREQFGIRKYKSNWYYDIYKSGGRAFKGDIPLILGAMLSVRGYEKVGKGFLEEAKLANLKFAQDPETAKNLETWEWADLAPGKGWWTGELAQSVFSTLPLLPLGFGAGAAVAKASEATLKALLIKYLARQAIAAGSKKATTEAAKKALIAKAKKDAIEQVYGNLASGGIIKPMTAAEIGAATSQIAPSLVQRAGVRTARILGRGKEGWYMPSGSTTAGVLLSTAPLEALMEAGHIHQSVMEATGGDKERAGKAAASVFWNNLAWLAVTNAIGQGVLSKAWKGAPKEVQSAMLKYGLTRMAARESLKRTPKALGGSVLAGVGEGIEEAFGQEFFGELGDAIGRGEGDRYFEPFGQPLVNTLGWVLNQEFTSDGQRRSFVGGLMMGASAHGGAKFGGQLNNLRKFEGTKKTVKRDVEASGAMDMEGEQLIPPDVVEAYMNWYQGIAEGRWKTSADALRALEAIAGKAPVQAAAQAKATEGEEDLTKRGRVGEVREVNDTIRREMQALDAAGVLKDEKSQPQVAEYLAALRESLLNGTTLPSWNEQEILNDRSEREALDAAGKESQPQVDFQYEIPSDREGAPTQPPPGAEGAPTQPPPGEAAADTERYLVLNRTEGPIRLTERGRPPIAFEKDKTARGRARVANADPNMEPGAKWVVVQHPTEAGKFAVKLEKAEAAAPEAEAAAAPEFEAVEYLRTPATGNMIAPLTKKAAQNKADIANRKKGSEGKWVVVPHPTKKGKFTVKRDDPATEEAVAARTAAARAAAARGAARGKTARETAAARGPARAAAAARGKAATETGQADAAMRKELADNEVAEQNLRLRQDFPQPENAEKITEYLGELRKSIEAGQAPPITFQDKDKGTFDFGFEFEGKLTPLLPTPAAPAAAPVTPPAPAPAAAPTEAAEGPIDVSGIDVSTPEQRADELVKMEIADKINAGVIYRGAREGNPQKLYSGKGNFFISSESYAKTYGATAAWNVTIENPLIVSEQEWMKLTQYDPEALNELFENNEDRALMSEQMGEEYNPIDSIVYVATSSLVAVYIPPSNQTNQPSPRLDKSEKRKTSINSVTIVDLGKITSSQMAEIESTGELEIEDRVLTGKPSAKLKAMWEKISTPTPTAPPATTEGEDASRYELDPFDGRPRAYFSRDDAVMQAEVFVAEKGEEWAVVEHPTIEDHFALERTAAATPTPAAPAAAPEAPAPAAAVSPKRHGGKGELTQKKGIAAYEYLGFRMQPLEGPGGWHIHTDDDRRIIKGRDVSSTLGGATRKEAIAEFDRRVDEYLAEQGKVSEPTPAAAPEAAAPAPPKASEAEVWQSSMRATWDDASQRAKENAEFDALSDDALIRVFHGTTKENAASIREQGVAGHKPRGDLANPEEGLYLSPTHTDALRYTGTEGEVVELVVRKDDMRIPELHSVLSLGEAFFNSAIGTYLPKGSPLQVAPTAPTPIAPAAPAPAAAPEAAAPAAAEEMKPDQLIAVGTTITMEVQRRKIYADPSVGGPAEQVTVKHATIREIRASGYYVDISTGKSKKSRRAIIHILNDGTPHYVKYLGGITGKGVYEGNVLSFNITNNENVSPEKNFDVPVSTEFLEGDPTTATPIIPTPTAPATTPTTPAAPAAPAAPDPNRPLQAQDLEEQNKILVDGFAALQEVLAKGPPPSAKETSAEGVQGEEVGIGTLYGEFTKAIDEVSTKDIVNRPGIRTIDGVDFFIEVGDDAVDLQLIQTPSPLRGQGKASNALKKFLAVADSVGIAVEGDVRPVSAKDITTEQLLAWYKRNGFVETGKVIEGNPVVRREPEGVAPSTPPTARHYPESGGGKVGPAEDSPASAAASMEGVGTYASSPIVPSTDLNHPDRNEEQKGKPVRNPFDIVRTLQDFLNTEFVKVYTKQKRGKQPLGLYVPPPSDIIQLSSLGDVIVLAHEIGHYLEHAYDMLTKISDPMRSELSREGNAQGSRVPQNWPKEASEEQYLMGEGFAVFLQMLTFNPELVAQTMPSTLTHYKNKVPPEIRKALSEYSIESRLRYGLDPAEFWGGGTIGSGKEHKPLSNDILGTILKQVKAAKETGESLIEGEPRWIEHFEDGMRFTVGFWDYVQKNITNPYQFMEAVTKTAQWAHGRDDLMPLENPLTLVRLFSQIAGKINSFVEQGPFRYTSKGLEEQFDDQSKEFIQRRKEDSNAVAQNMNLPWVLEPYGELKVYKGEGEWVTYGKLSDLDQTFLIRLAVEYMQAQRVVSLWENIDAVSDRLKEIDAKKKSLEKDLRDIRKAETEDINTEDPEKAAKSRAMQKNEIESHILHLDHEVADFGENLPKNILERARLPEKQRKSFVFPMESQEELELARRVVAQVESGEMDAKAPGAKDRVLEAARRYRGFMATGLDYQLDAGRLSQKDYDRIVKFGDHYVEMRRLNLLAPSQTKSAVVGNIADGVSARWSSVVQGLEQDQLGQTSGDFLDAALKDFRKTGVKKGLLQPLNYKGFSGSMSPIINPYITMYEAMDRMITEADRNQAVRTLADLLEASAVPEVETRGLLHSMGHKSVKEDPFSVPIWRDGEIEWFNLQPDLHRQVAQMSEQSFQVIWPLTLYAKAVRWTVTRHPVFLMRQRFRDFQERQYISRSLNPLMQTLGGGAIADLIKTLGPVDEETTKLLMRFGGDQAYHRIRGRKEWNSELRGILSRMRNDSNVFVVNTQRMFEVGRKFVENSDRATRNLEFISSVLYYEKVKGYDPLNARLQAAFEAVDLMQFQMAGDWMKTYRQIEPFGAVGVIALQRKWRAMKEHPGQYAYLVSMTMLSTWIGRAAISALDLDDEYDQLPGWMRDMGWCIPIPLGDRSDQEITWGWIPKSYEWGLYASFADRMYSHEVLGNKRAFDGFQGSVLRILFPFEFSGFFGPIQPVMEWATNRDFFKDRYIIPKYEIDLPLHERKGITNASRLAKSLSTAFGFLGKPFFEPRKLDHFMKSTMGYYGKNIVSASNIGRDNVDAFTLTDLGFFRQPHPTQFQSVNSVFNLIEEDGRVKDSRQYKAFRAQLRLSQDHDDPDERRRRALLLVPLADKVLDLYDRKYKDTPVPTIENW